jgi:hypothetical protein
MRRSGRNRWGSMAVCLLAACGGSADVVEPDPAINAFVGTWDATVYTIWPDANPSFTVDVLDEIGAFYITVEPSGQYTAVLEAGIGAQVQIGQLTVIGSTLRLDVTTPANEPSITGNFAFTASDYLVLDGPIQIDFNNDGTDDPGQSHIELQKR